MSADSKRTVSPAITGELDLNNAFHILPEKLQPWRPAIMSYSSCLFSTIVGFPLDSVKTRLQTHNFNGIIDCLSKTIQSEGVKGLFRGLTAPLLSTSVTKALGVSIYTDVKPYAAVVQESIIKLLQVSSHDSKKKQAFFLALSNAPVSFIAGMISGTICSLFACPFEFTKLFQQIYILKINELGLSPRRIPKTTWEVARQIRRSEGLRGLYSGFRFHVLRDAFGSGLFFSVYETAKILIDGFATPEGKISGTNIPIGTVSITLAASCSGAFSWILVFPIDTIKSLTQRDIVSNIIRGLALKPHKPILMRPLTLTTREMYKGLSVSVTRSVFTSVAFFSCFEYLMKHIA